MLSVLVLPSQVQLTLEMIELHVKSILDLYLFGAGEVDFLDDHFDIL